jgi:hypothetical protein
MIVVVQKMVIVLLFRRLNVYLVLLYYFIVLSCCLHSKRSKEKNAFMLQLVLMNRKSDFMGLDPYKLDPEYLVEKIKLSTFNRRNNSTITIFCTTTIIFQIIISFCCALWYWRAQVPPFCRTLSVLESTKVALF